MVGVARGHQRADTLKTYSQKTSQSNHTRTTAFSNSMKLWAKACRVTQDGRVMVESSDKMWSTGEGNGKPLQYSCLENPMNRIKGKKYTKRWTPQVGRCKEIQPVHPKGNQSWILIGRTDVEPETPILCPPDAKNWLIWKDPYAGEDWSGRRRRWQRVKWLDGITSSMDMSLHKLGT